MFAQIESGAVKAWAGAVPERKEGEPVQDWRPLVIEYPEHDKRTYQVGNHTDTVEATRVVRTWAVTPRAPDADDVRAEAQRRIVALTGARDLQGAMIKQSNANMRANALNDKRLLGQELAPAEEAEAAALRNLAAAIVAIRAASNVLEPNPPADYAADKYWPPYGV